VWEEEDGKLDESSRHCLGLRKTTGLSEEKGVREKSSVFEKRTLGRIRPLKRGGVFDLSALQFSRTTNHVKNSLRWKEKKKEGGGGERSPESGQGQRLFRRRCFQKNRKMSGNKKGGEMRTKLGTGGGVGWQKQSFEFMRGNGVSYSIYEFQGS